MICCCVSEVLRRLIVLLNDAHRLLLLHQLFIKIIFHGLSNWSLWNSGWHHWAQLFYLSFFGRFISRLIVNKFYNFPLLYRFILVQYFRLYSRWFNQCRRIFSDWLKIFKVNWRVIPWRKFRVSHCFPFKIWLTNLILI